MKKRVIVVSLLRRVSSVKGRSVIRVERPSVSESLNQVRVGDVVSSHSHDISFLPLELRDCVIPVEVSAGQEQNSRRLENLAEDVERVNPLTLLCHFRRGAIGERGKLLLLVEHLIEARLNPIEVLVMFLEHYTCDAYI